MKKVAFHNLGCKVNAYEMEYLQQVFEKSGYEIVPFATKADNYIVNTCIVTNIADRKSRQMLHRAKKTNPGALVVAVGCYVQTDPDGVSADPLVDLAIGNNRKREVLSLVEAYLSGEGNIPALSTSDLSQQAAYEEMEVTDAAGHTRAHVKIQDGCDQFCSYCIIPFARGRSRSRKEEDILREIGVLAKNGYREIVMSGIHASSYGIDRMEEKTTYNRLASSGDFTNEALLHLLKEADRVEGIVRIRLGSLEPRVITEEFLEGLKNIPSFCRHFHLSLQSGSDTVLARMNRHYTAKEYLEKVRLIRRYFPDAALTADVIVGFPGESGEEFETTRAFLNEADLYEVHVFKYSRRRGTVADRLPCQLTEAQKQKRSEVLIRESATRRTAFEKRMIGKEVNVLFEEAETIGGMRYLTGFTDHYIRCAIPEGEAETGEPVRCAVRGLLTDEILEVSREK